MEFVTSSATFVYKDEDGTVILEAPLLELSFFIGSVSRRIRETEPDIDPIDIAKKALPAVNAEFKSEMNYGQLMQLTGEVNRQMNELKKKNS